jgi:hypothetical protein
LLHPEANQLLILLLEAFLFRHYFQQHLFGVLELLLEVFDVALQELHELLGLHLAELDLLPSAQPPT